MPALDSDSEHGTNHPPPRTTRQVVLDYLAGFLVLVLAPTAIAAVFVTSNFRPSISQDFLFLYFGITSAVATAVWSTFVLAEKSLDKRHLFFPTLLLLAAAIVSLFAAISATAETPVLLDTSASFILSGLGWMGFQSVLHVIRSESPASR